MASFIVVMGFMALSQLLSTMMAASSLSRHTMRATSLAQQRIEEIVADGFNPGQSGSQTALDFYTVTWTTTADSIPTIMDIEVVVEWDDHRGRTHSIEMESMLAQRRSGYGNMPFYNVPIFQPPFEWEED